MMKVNDHDFHGHNSLESFFDPEVVKCDPVTIVDSDTMCMCFLKDTFKSPKTTWFANS